MAKATAIFIIPCLFVSTIWSGTCAGINYLDVYITRRELKRFLSDFDFRDFYIIRQGVIDNFVKNKATTVLYPIKSSINHLELKFQSKQKLYYKITLSSSDKTVMRQPTTTIKRNGLVTKKTSSFRIRFPCTRRKTALAMLKIKMEFMLPSNKRKPIAMFELILKRSCEKRSQDSARTEKPSPAEPRQVCSKKCDKRSVMKKLCLNDFAIRGRVEKITKGNNENLQLKVRVTKRYKLSRVSIGHRIMMDVIGKEVTCTCEPIKIRKTYLFLGKESRRTATFFLDNNTYAISWHKGGKKLAKLRKRKSTCPKRFGTRWYPQEV